ncbi:MAG: glycogen/starch/alpha-glucan family phosphorylase, partial [Oscillospiraceae bacterium]|nr:glycogen/starch/alpha-glucan family phosphorylase [Oscillospiraceae bacterium]
SFLYPDDSDEAGRLLRVYQQYFMVSAGAQLILKELEERGFTPETLGEHVAIQINDTHPSMVIPELVRLLTARGLSMDAAVEQVSKTCAYTNHTILAEALEKWPLTFIERVAPQLVPIIRELDRRAKAVHPDPRVAMLQGEKGHEIVHMAHMDIHYGYSVNGVAALHTDILKSAELKPFYDIYPDKFNNKTNGVTLRRWLEVCNPQLAALLDECVGAGWRTDPARLNKLMDYYNDSAVLDKILEIKAANKRCASDLFIRDQYGIRLDPESVFDIQVKRLHEYKRQQMNALYVIHKYLEIKSGKTPERPVTVIFGAKAAPAYVMAKHIIHLILCLRRLIENDPQVRPWLHVAMVENYNVTWAERLIPACDISEQISLASKEASGTGNMKFMANGAVTLGTLDGANVEIAELVGPDNIYTFGASSGWVIELEDQRKKGLLPGYQPMVYYDRPAVKPLVDFLMDRTLVSKGDEVALRALWSDMTCKDWFMALLDVEAYIAARDRAVSDYGDRTAWARKMLVNTARSGFFSSDRTIAEYNQDIWHLD